VPETISLRVKQPGHEADLHLVPSWRMVELYLQSPIHLLSMVLNELSTTITLPFTSKFKVPHFALMKNILKLIHM
jgi:hypothetical protein